MATFIPSLEEIQNNQMEQPTAGEWTLLNKLSALDDTYEIYFQSHINLAHPDIVILKKGSGAIIIEVKDWNLNAYEFKNDFSSSEFGIMIEKSRNSEIRNPFEQVHMYKEELFNLYSSALHIKNLTNTHTYGVVKCAVYFSNATENQVENKFGKDNFKQKKFKNFYQYWANDSGKLIQNIQYMLRENCLFTDEIYKQISRVLSPSLEWREQSEFFTLSSEQSKFAVSENGRRQKIKGVPGSGKTLVLAKRAVNCYKRIHEPVLILTFNITLRHYIKDKISQITRDLSTTDKRQFHIMHIHEFAKQMLDNDNIFYKKPTKYQTPNEILEEHFLALQNAKSRISRKYKAILIDEVQDFEYSWLKNVEELFLADNGEFVLFGDEKQNIYNRSVDENKLPRTRINGRWALLKESYRMTLENGQLAQNFQKHYFKDKYETSPIEYVQETLDNYFARKEIRYYEVSKEHQNAHTIYRILEQFRNDGTIISANDICILSNNCNTLRLLEDYFKTALNIHSETTCESKKEYEELLRLYNENHLSEKAFKEELYKIRRIKKFAFHMNPGVIKLSTIHSFKGWEINTVVLLLDKQAESHLQDELVYTAITRAKKNLVIINLGNNRYRNFFKKEIKTYTYNANM